MGGPYFAKVATPLARRFTLTNRRIVVRRGLRGVPAWQVLLVDIEDVLVRADANSGFFRAGLLEVITAGRVALRLAGVPEGEAFRRTVFDACRACVPRLAQVAGRTGNE
jgi:hypothetical protein